MVKLEGSDLVALCAFCSVLAYFKHFHTAIGYPPGHLWSKAEIVKAMENILTLDDLCSMIIALDEQEPET